jgi:hypothetical protein
MAFATAFLSHSSVDKTLVEQVANALGRRGIIPWLDKYDLTIGKSLTESLKEAIHRQVALVLFLSEQAVASRWVQEELREALRLEDDERNKNWILPVYLSDPFHLVTRQPVLAERWLSAERDRVDRLGIYQPSSESTSLDVHTEQIADKVAHSVYRLLRIQSLDEINLVIDQRGYGLRTELYALPPNIAKLDYPTLVFRPDTGARSEYETQVGHAWNILRRTMAQSLSTALGNVRTTPRKIWLIGNAQIGFAYFLGQYFDRTTTVTLYCYSPGHPEVFTNQGQERREPLTGGNPNCETTVVEGMAQTSWLPPKLQQNEKYPKVAFYIGNRRYLPDVREHLESEQIQLPLVFVETGMFNTSEEVLKFVRDVVALLQRLREHHGTTIIRFYCGLPFHVLPLLTANLTHTTNTIEFMEYRRDLQGQECSPKEMYVHLPMKS